MYTCTYIIILTCTRTFMHGDNKVECDGDCVEVEPMLSLFRKCQYYGRTGLKEYEN